MILTPFLTAHGIRRSRNLIILNIQWSSFKMNTYRVCLVFFVLNCIVGLYTTELKF